jgi:hypothetical protein
MQFTLQGQFSKESALRDHCKTKLLIISRTLFDARSENYTEPKNTLCGENRESLNVTAGGRLYEYNRWDLSG